jgi:signal transduction histidine kinase
MTINPGGRERIRREHSVIGMPGMLICSRGGRAVPSWPADRLAADYSPETEPPGNYRAESVAACARIVAAADDVRRRIERDLHDGLQQQLVSLGLRARLAEASAPPDLRELKCELARIAEGLMEALENLREISHGIHPAILSERGLEAAVKALARRSMVPVQLDIQASARLPEPVEVAAYYVICEALTNAAKHAHASVIHVDAEMVGQVLRLRVRDDGAGGADPARGTGLVGLKDRVEALGGTITIRSPGGAGTCLYAELPLTG